MAVIPILPVVPNLYTCLSLSFPLHYPLHCSRPQGCLLCHPFTPRFLRPLSIYLDWSRQSSLPKVDMTAFPQGFRENPHFFGQALASDLISLDLILSTVLQYVAELLIHCQQHIIQLLYFLSDWGYLISSTRIQLSLPRITYHGVLLSPTKRYITTESSLYPPYHSLHQKQISCPSWG